MKILVVNTGSSSLKFNLYEMPEEKVLIKGTFERIGLGESFYSIKHEGKKDRYEVDLPNHAAALKFLTEDLVKYKVIEDLDEIKAVGHRVVQGGKACKESKLVDESVEEAINRLIPIAPLHLPANIMGIEAAKEVIAKAPNVAVFDTTFHQTIQEDRYLYALPYEFCEKYNIRKYGFHGISHRYLTEFMQKELNKKEVNLITCHIGNGASLAAVKDGLCFDTSMGFTPNAGLIMGSRSGDIDYSVIPYLKKVFGITLEEFDSIANKESGLLGISGISSDSRDIENAIEEGNERAILAQKMYCNRIVEYIAKYYLALEGKVDGIIFTAGIGENSSKVREEVIRQLAPLGIYLDEEANKLRGEYKLISNEDSKVAVYTLPTNEELLIARDAYNIVK